ncbi:MAG: TatD family hydrolase [Bacteroidota bacterium]
MKYPGFINIHTHQETSKENVLNIKNLFPNQLREIEENSWYSMGIHPWYIEKNRLENELNVVREKGSGKNIVAIGEIGLDKLKGEEWSLQKDVFEKQVIIAQEVNKPVIIHCVKAYPDVLSVHKKMNPKVPFIIHGFNGNEQVADQLLKKGMYLSFGSLLLKDNFKGKEVFKKIPANAYLLETDDSDVSIEIIYKKAAEIKKTSLENIRQEISENFKKIFFSR